MSTEIDMALPFGGAPKHESREDAQRPVGRLVSSRVTVDELRVVCDTIIELVRLRQNECKHLCVENVAPEIMRKLLLEVSNHKLGMVRADDLGC